jgi:hypothetical protein
MGATSESQSDVHRKDEKIAASHICYTKGDTSRDGALAISHFSYDIAEALQTKASRCYVLVTGLDHKSACE